MRHNRTKQNANRWIAAEEMPCISYSVGKRFRAAYPKRRTSFSFGNFFPSSFRTVITGYTLSLDFARSAPSFGLGCGNNLFCPQMGHLLLVCIWISCSRTIRALHPIDLGDFFAGAPNTSSGMANVKFVARFIIKFLLAKKENGFRKEQKLNKMNTLIAGPKY